MNFKLTEEQEAVRDLAAQIFAGQATVERVKAVEGSDERFDRDLWRALADANLLGIALPDDVGGTGLGLTELCLVLEQQGRAVAPVPLWPTLVLGALAIAEHGTPAQRDAWLPSVGRGDVVLTAALAETGVNDPLRPRVTATRDGQRWRLDGLKVSVPAGHVADRVLVPARVDGGDDLVVLLVDPAGAGVQRDVGPTTDRQLVGHLHFDGEPAEMLGDGHGGGGRHSADAGGARLVNWMLDRALLGLCAIQVGVCEEATRLAAEYTSGREQFGRPLSTFQGAQIKAADAYIDTEAMRVTMLQAAWKLDVGRAESRDVMVAKWWASEAGQRVVHRTQHLHGGMGADVDYPVHRYFLWGKQIEDTLGGGSAQLARLGRAIAEDAA